MKNKKLFKRAGRYLGVTLFGIIFSLAFLEAALWVFAGFQQVRQHWSNRSDVSDELVILALGESTTMPIHNSQGKDISWPALLEKELNQADLDIKIKVINEGRGGINSEYILQQLAAWLKKYQPDLVVSMMGINDYGQVEYEAQAGIKPTDFWSRFRTYQLAKLLINQSKQNSPSLIQDCSSAGNCMLQAAQALEIGNKSHAFKLWQQTLEYDPDNLTALLSLGNFYLDQNNADSAEKYFQILESKHSDQLSVTSALGRFYLISGQPEIATRYFEQVLAEDSKNVFAYIGLIDSLAGERNTRDNLEKIALRIEQNQVKSVSLQAILVHKAQRLGYQRELPNFSQEELDQALADPGSLVNAARHYVRFGKLDQAENFYLKILENDSLGSLPLIELLEFNPSASRTPSLAGQLKQLLTTNDQYAAHYQQLSSELKQRGIPLIAVQYPLRSTVPLEIIFENHSLVWIVDNEQSFERALAAEGVDKIFFDQFAGDFGHCTAQGNRLIAKNIKDKIVNHWSKIFQSEAQP